MNFGSTLPEFCTFKNTNEYTLWLITVACTRDI